MQTNEVKGVRGGLIRTFLDRLLGPGASPVEVSLALGAGLSFAFLIPALARTQEVGWSTLQFIVAGLLAFDLFGGIVVNASGPARRFYHRAGRRRRDHIAFVTMHTFHVLVVAWLFRGSDWNYAGLFSAALLTSALIVLFTQLHLRRPVAMLAYAGVLLLALSMTSPTPGLEWFIPALFLKLLLSYLLGDVPAHPLRA